MYIYVTEPIFREYFEARRPDSFSHQGLGLLYEYLDERDEEQGETRFDVIAIDSEFAEYSSAMEAVQDAGLIDDLDLPPWEDEAEQIAREYLEDITIAYWSDGILIKTGIRPY